MHRNELKFKFKDVQNRFGFHLQCHLIQESYKEACIYCMCSFDVHLINKMFSFGDSCKIYIRRGHC